MTPRSIDALDEARGGRRHRTSSSATSCSTSTGMWAERMCAASGLTAVEPLWGESTEIAVSRVGGVRRGGADRDGARRVSRRDVARPSAARASCSPNCARLGVDPVRRTRRVSHRRDRQPRCSAVRCSLRREGHVQRSGCWARRSRSGRQRLGRRACCTRLRFRSHYRRRRADRGRPRIARHRARRARRPARPERLAARRRCSSCWAACCVPRQGSVAFEGRRLADWPRREAARKIAVRPAGNARAVRLQRDGNRADGTVSPPRIRSRSRAPKTSRSRSGPLDATGMSAFAARPVPHAQRRREAARGHRQRAGAGSRTAAARRADGVARRRPPARGAAAARRG